MAQERITLFLQLFLHLQLNMRCLEGRSLLKRRRFRRRKMMCLFINATLTSLELAYPDRRLWSKVRSSVFWENVVLSSWDDKDFKENFRITRTTFNYICGKLRSQLVKKHVVRKPISVERRVAIALSKLGSCGELRTIANLFGVARSTACTIVAEVCSALSKEFKITFPQNYDLQMIAQRFYDNGGLPGCCGAIDGSYIPIKAPNKCEKDYFCRKQFFSIIVQAVVDDRLRFVNLNIGWPGSVHDARVFRNSNLFRAGEMNKLFSPTNIQLRNHNGNVKPFLVGDQAYPLLNWLMKPHGGHLNAERALFNKKLSTSRINVEHAFGQLKGRWRCLLKENDSNVDNVKSQVLACCLLHNICITLDDEFLNDWLILEEGNSDVSSEDDNLSISGENLTRNLVSGTDVRDFLMQNL
ncbi:putative nuclease HARBI1, partial [Stegodyphus mimosarum]